MSRRPHTFDVMATIDSSTNPVTAVQFAIAGGRFRIRLTSDDGPGRRSGHVLNDADEVIGDASDHIYRGSAFPVHTKPFAGHVAIEQVDFV